MAVKRKSAGRGTGRRDLDKGRIMSAGGWIGQATQQVEIVKLVDVIHEAPLLVGCSLNDLRRKLGNSAIWGTSGVATDKRHSCWESSQECVRDGFRG